MTKIPLHEVTLLAISSILIPETIEALQKSSTFIKFGAIKIISHEEPEDLPSDVSFEKCPKINDIDQFNHYVFKDLTKHVNTEFCLMIQYHGYAIHPDVWDNSWLEYDYIGAPWQIIPNTYIADNGEIVRVGNGGFSLRSKKILDAPRKLDLALKQEQGWYNEDGNLCCYHRTALLDYGVRYAPVEIAANFSYEKPVPENKGKRTFGFHRNLPQ